MTQWFAKDHIALLNKYKDSRESSIVYVRDALQSHKAVSANPFGFVRADCFESPALLLVGDGAPQD